MKSVGEYSWQKTLKSAHTFLKRWNGNAARLWHFQAPHCLMTLRIEKPFEEGNLHIRCGDPEFVHGPVFWNNCDIDVEVFTDESGEVFKYIVRDEKAGFELRCETIEFAENCKPL